MSLPREAYAGVDAGGSRSTAVAVDSAGVEVARREAGPSGFQDLGPEVAARRISALLDELRTELVSVAFGGTVRRLVCALAGAGRHEPAVALERILAARQLADEVAVVTDAEAALHAAFGDGPGIVVIAGTGAIAVGRDADGRLGRAGGARPKDGDPGSGEWLVRQAVHSVLSRGRDSPLRSAIFVEAGLSEGSHLEDWVRTASRAEIARIGRGVGESADAGDPDAAELVARAGQHLADLALAVEARLGPWIEVPRLALAGGLLEPGRPVRRAVTEALVRKASRLEAVSERVDGALGAARLALRGGFAAGERR